MTEKESVIAKLTAVRAELKRFGVKRLGLFGSVARDESGPDSDVDFLVEFIRPSFDNFMDLTFFLEDLIGKKVELVCPDSLRPASLSRVEREMILVV